VPPHVLDFASEDEGAAAALAALYHAAPETAAPPTLRYRLRRHGDDAWTAECPSRPPFGPAGLADAWAFLEWRAIEDVLNDPGPHTVFVHAAGVSVGTRLLLLVGASGSGKSTLSALLLARGHTILGDDIVRFDCGTGQFDAVPRSLKLDNNTLDLLDLQSKRRVQSSPGTVYASDIAYVSPAALHGEWRAAPGRPWAVVVLGDAPHQGPATLRRCGEGEPAIRVIRSVLGAAHRAGALDPNGSLIRLVESLQDIVAFQAGGGEPPALADLIEESATA
jgi:hypothetical protein